MPDPRPPLRADVRRLRRPILGQAVVFAVAATTLAAEAVTVVAERQWPGGGVGVVLAAIAVALVTRRPLVALVLGAASPVLAALLSADPTALWSVAVFVAFLLTVRGSAAVVVAPVVGLADAVSVALFSGFGPSVVPTASVAGFAAVAASAIGSAMRNRRRYLHELEQRIRAAEDGRDAAVRTGVAEERVRIARDLHDTIGHEVAVLGMHLGAAEVQLRSAPDAAAEELSAARSGIKSVLAETQQVLRILRDADDGAQPTPGHLRIPELVDALRAGGAEIDVRADVLPGALAPQVSLAAYRITQEALTNAQRYGTGSAALRIDVQERTLRIEVVNAIADRTPPQGGGAGVAGMRARAAAAGGRLDAGPDGSLFWLRAELPVTEARS